MEVSNWFKKVFKITALVTGCAWILEWTCASFSGEKPKTILLKVQNNLNHTELVKIKDTADIKGVERIVIDAGKFDVEVYPTKENMMQIEFEGSVSDPKKFVSFERTGKQLTVVLNSH